MIVKNRHVCKPIVKVIEPISRIDQTPRKVQVHTFISINITLHVAFYTIMLISWLNICYCIINGEYIYIHTHTFQISIFKIL